MRGFYRQAFRRDVALGALASVSGWPQVEDDPKPLIRALRAALDQGDAATAVLLARRLRAFGPLDGALAMRCRRQLLALGLFAEALETIAAGDGPGDGEQDWHAALALAGLGRPAEALARIEAARRRGLAPEELKGLEHLLGGAASRALVELALQHGLGDLAVKALCPLFQSGAPADGAPLVERLDLARSALRIASPDQGVRLLQALEPLYATSEDRAAWLSVRRVQADGADDDVQMQAPAKDPVRHRLAYILAAACASSRAWPAAIRRFGRAVSMLERQDEHFHELARCVEEDLRQRSPFRLAAQGPRRRIVDVSPFNGEFTLLEIKLNEMADWVDAFVIYEARHTYTGLPKPIYFPQGRARFARFADKIVHVVIDEAPPYAREAWARELYQRASAAQAVSRLVGPDDLVMLTDTDEVLERAKVEAFEGLHTSCGLRTFCWFLNYRLLAPVKQGAKSCLVKGRFVAAIGTAAIRLALGSLIKDVLPEVGWHFTSVLPAADLKTKLDSYSHEDWAGSTVAEQAAFLNRIREGDDYPGYARQELDLSFPRWVREHREELAQFIL